MDIGDKGGKRDNRTVKLTHAVQDLTEVHCESLTFDTPRITLQKRIDFLELF